MDAFLNLPPLMRDLLPELILVAAACLLFLMGATSSKSLRQASPWVAMAGLLLGTIAVFGQARPPMITDDLNPTLAVTDLSLFVKLLSLLVGGLLVLLHWPTDAEGSGNGALQLGNDSPEYFGLMLLSLTGILLVASANDIILLFLGIEMASIPTYVMLSMSRPIASAQEAALKYFFLGAFSAAVTLFGLTFLFGATGTLSLSTMAHLVSRPELLGGQSPWLLLAGAAIVLGLAFKLAAFPLHFYAPDVYTGAATPLTALLSFVPKTAGVIALLKVLWVMSGGVIGNVPRPLVMLLWVMAVATMTIGNVLGLMQYNVKRMMACSSIAHSGYLLTALAVFVSASGLDTRNNAIDGILFYLAVYGLMNIGVFAVLMMLPAKSDPFVHEGQVPPATTAETMAELAGTGRSNPGLALIMAICCFSLIGLPLTAGFFGKLYLIKPALEGGQLALVVILVVNAAISAGYYLRIVATMFLKEPRPVDLELTPAVAPVSPSAALALRTAPLMLAGILSAGGSIFLGTVIPSTMLLRSAVRESRQVLPDYFERFRDGQQAESPSPASDGPLAQR
jgi:NADH-quinone oxidoreductase subunit N